MLNSQLQQKYTEAELASQKENFDVHRTVQVQHLEESTVGLVRQKEAAQAQATAAQLEAQAQQQSKDALERQLAAVEGKALRQQQGKVDAAQQRAEQFEVGCCSSQVPWGDKLLQSSSAVSRAVQGTLL